MNPLREYIRVLVTEKQQRDQKDKRTLYHINRFRPARPQPKMKYMQDWDPKAIDPDTGERTGDMVNIPGTNNWDRWWLDSPVESGVFLTPNPLDIAINHGRSGHVYAYKVPEWVIDKSGGMHRYDTGSELLIPEDVWNEAGKEIEFMGKSMEQEELWKKMESPMYGRGHHRKSNKPSWMSDKELEQWQAGQDKFNLAGLRSTKHPEDVIKLLKPEEREKAVAAIEAKKEDIPGFVEKGSRDKKGIVVPPFGQQLDKKDEELLRLLQKHMKESTLRECIREMLKEQKVLAQGMCFPFAIQKAEEWFEDHFVKGTRGRKPKRHPDLNNMDKFKVVHGKVTDKWEKPPKPIVHAWVEMGDLVFDDQTKHTKPDGVPKDVYYDMYQPEVHEEYTAEDALMKCVWEGGEGPWNKELRDIMQQRDARV